MKCLICDTEAKSIFSHMIMKKYDVDYFQCQNCGLIFTESPFWLEESYSDAITEIDTGIMARNLSFSMRSNLLIKNFLDPNAKFLDFAGGYGIFVRLMRDKGFDFYWMDKFSENLFARGFEHNCDKVELVTAFEVFEHFEDPNQELENLVKLSDNILFSTLIYDENLELKNMDWWYYVFETGQHITFYSEKTLKYLADKNKVSYYRINDSLHLFSKKQLEVKKIQRVCNSKIRLLINWFKNGRKSFTVSDMELLKEEYK